MSMRRRLTVSGETYTALSSLYSSTAGESWTNKANWMSGDPCTAGWFRVVCVSGEVTELQMQVNKLAGTIPSELGLLIEMTYRFYLYMNSLTGSIPSELGGLSKLVGMMQFESNSLTGSIPSELGSMAEMSHGLYLDGNTTMVEGFFGEESHHISFEEDGDKGKMLLEKMGWTGGPLLLPARGTAEPDAPPKFGWQSSGRH